VGAGEGKSGDPSGRVEIGRGVRRPIGKLIVKRGVRSGSERKCKGLETKVRRGD